MNNKHCFPVSSGPILHEYIVTNHGLKLSRYPIGEVLFGCIFLCYLSLVNVSYLQVIKNHSL